MENKEIKENNIIHMDKETVRKEIRQKIKHAASTCLKTKQFTHKKMKHIQYDKFEAQEYLEKTSILSNKEAKIITALRSQTVRGINNNCHSFYNVDIQCKLCLQSLDSQEHCVECPKILEKVKPLKKHILYEHIYGNVYE